MCFKMDCKGCGKVTWGGCGKHVASVHASIEEGKHCMCRSWPGVAVASDTKQQSGSSNSSQGEVSISLKHTQI